MKKQSVFPRTLQEISVHRQFIYGASALWIMFYHFNTDVAERGLLYLVRLLQATGTCGVEVFLLLTGFGLYGALNRNPDVFRFYRRRLARVLVPALILLFGCDLIVCARLYGYEITPMFVFAWLWRGRLWYVSFILIMYLLYPLLHRWIRPENKKRWIAAFMLSFILIFVLEFLPINISKEALRALTRVPVFLLGCMLAPAVQENRAIPRGSLPCLLVPACIGTFAWVLMHRAGYMYSLRMLAFLFLGAAVILLLTAFARLLQKNGAGRKVYGFFLFCGSISLEIYLVFDRVRELLEFIPGAGNIHSFGLDIIAALLTLPLAYLLRRLCEKLISAFQPRRA